MFGALHIPDFTAVSALRRNSHKNDAPFAVLAERKGRDEAKLPLLAVNRCAGMTGIGRGWTLNRALVRCPDLRVIARDPVMEAELRAELVVLAESLTPDLEIASEDTVLIDLSRRLTPAVLESLRLPEVEVWHARAMTPDLAYLAARHALTHGRMISPVDLGPLPLAWLEALGAGVDLGLLDLWGVKKLGDFMKMPRQALVERLRSEVGWWHDVLHGKACRLLRLHRPPQAFAQELEFDDPVVSHEPLVFAIKRLLHTLAARLASRHLAVSCLDLRLTLEFGPPVLRRVRLPDPQIQLEGMLPPLQTLLESIRLDAAVCGLKLDVETTYAMTAQREWFGRQLPQPARWAETLAKLEVLLGPGRIGIPLPSDSHRPDDFTLHPATGNQVTDQVTLPTCPLPLHRFRPPLEIVVASESRGGRLLPLALLNGPHLGEITDRRGPFPFSGSWWDPQDAWQRVEWDVQLVSRHLLRLAFLAPDRWLLDGIYR